jgi:hypothetical protein
MWCMCPHKHLCAQPPYLACSSEHLQGTASSNKRLSAICCCQQHVSNSHCRVQLLWQNKVTSWVYTTSHPHPPTSTVEPSMKMRSSRSWPGAMSSTPPASRCFMRIQSGTAHTYGVTQGRRGKITGHCSSVHRASGHQVAIANMGAVLPLYLMGSCQAQEAPAHHEQPAQEGEGL